MFELLKAAYLCRQLLNLVVEKVEHFYVSQVCDVCWHSCGKVFTVRDCNYSKLPRLQILYQHLAFALFVQWLQHRKHLIIRIKKVYMQKASYLELVLIAESTHFVLLKNYYQNCKIF